MDRRSFLIQAIGAATAAMNTAPTWPQLYAQGRLPPATPIHYLSAISEAAKSVDDKLMIFVAAGALVSGQSWDRVMFDVTGADLTQTMYEPADGLLAPVANSTTFAEFADGLRATDGAPSAWQWIDVHVGYSFTLDADGPDHTEKCAEMLKPFLPWIKAAS